MYIFDQKIIDVELGKRNDSNCRSSDELDTYELTFKTVSYLFPINVTRCGGVEFKIRLKVYLVFNTFFLFSI